MARKGTDSGRRSGIEDIEAGRRGEADDVRKARLVLVIPQLSKLATYLKIDFTQLERNTIANVFDKYKVL